MDSDVRVAVCGAGLRVWFPWPARACSVVDVRGLPARASVGKGLTIGLDGLPENVMGLLARVETRAAEIDVAGAALRVHVPGGHAEFQMEGESTVALRLCGRELVGIDVRFLGRP
ncbi:MULTISPECIES: hypothetical protein [Actinomadura]|uniref:Uncharacterized protein n=1 Tax=Actinomadura litoris TaxID=2678616 RepID=A0A7K1L2N4_9ACTN|nr:MULTISPECIES: hypothetical protein [Actinomadura]MBT2208770.1 hypothetical protein [Actinomadura sp. NEAU-AAG7]MUN38671.1 hypothetical protein [Actinomadura litoris]